jgi:hypothetical protein
MTDPPAARQIRARFQAAGKGDAFAAALVSSVAAELPGAQGAVQQLRASRAGAAERAEVAHLVVPSLLENLVGFIKGVRDPTHKVATKPRPVSPVVASFFFFFIFFFLFLLFFFFFFFFCVFCTHTTRTPADRGILSNVCFYARRPPTKCCTCGRPSSSRRASLWRSVRARPGRLSALSVPYRFPMTIHLVRGFCMGAQGA